MGTEAQIPVSATIPVLPDGVRVAFFAVEAGVRPSTQKRPHRVSPVGQEPSYDRHRSCLGWRHCLSLDTRPGEESHERTCGLRGVSACSQPIAQRLSTPDTFNQSPHSRILQVLEPFASASSHALSALRLGARTVVDGRTGSLDVPPPGVSGPVCSVPARSFPMSRARVKEPIGQGGIESHAKCSLHASSGTDRTTEAPADRRSSACKSQDLDISAAESSWVVEHCWTREHQRPGRRRAKPRALRKWQKQRQRRWRPRLSKLRAEFRCIAALLVRQQDLKWAAAPGSTPSFRSKVSGSLPRSSSNRLPTFFPVAISSTSDPDCWCQSRARHRPALVRDLVRTYIVSSLQWLRTGCSRPSEAPVGRRVRQFASRATLDACRTSLLALAGDERGRLREVLAGFTHCIPSPLDTSLELSQQGPQRGDTSGAPDQPEPWKWRQLGWPSRTQHAWSSFPIGCLKKRLENLWRLRQRTLTSVGVDVGIETYNSLWAGQFTTGRLMCSLCNQDSFGPSSRAVYMLSRRVFLFSLFLFQ